MQRVDSGRSMLAAVADRIFVELFVNTVKIPNNRHSIKKKSIHGLAFIDCILKKKKQQQKNWLPTSRQPSDILCDNIKFQRTIFTCE